VHPIILGSDGYGIVESVADVGQEWVGRRVVLCPSIGWGHNEAYQGQDYEILGLPRNGTFAQYVAVPVDTLYPAPEHLSAPSAAALPLAGLTAWRALMTRGAFRDGERVFVSGVGGGVATAAAKIALAAGADLVVSSSKAHKIEQAMAWGARGGVDYTQEKWRKAARALCPAGFDVIIDSAGGEGFGQLARLLAPGGRLVFFGGTRGAWPPLLPQHFFFRQISILGSTMGSPREFADMLEFVSKHRLEPQVDQVFDLADGAAAFARLEACQHFGKIVLAVDHG
jgi:NADPH:quinone reductase-like Zn-dependent oxidoreductase